MISVLAPFRETGDGSRSRLWAFVRSRLEAELPEAEIVETSDDGEDPFGKSLALNRGAAAASGDVLYVLDTDCYVPGEAVRATLERLPPNGWARPWRRKLKLSEEATGIVLDRGVAVWDRKRLRPLQSNVFWAAPPLMLRREVWEDVGGMDERYRGWGGEDVAFARVLYKLGHGFAVAGAAADCLHLWHPRIGVPGRDLWAGQDGLFPNRELDREYTRARGAEGIRAVIARRG